MIRYKNAFQPLALALACVFAAFSCADTSKPKPAISMMLPMSDEVRLATSVYLPDGKEGAWPVILERTPYNRANAQAIPYVGDGYAVVTQNLRGTHGSEGEWDVFGHDGWGGPGRQDGLDTVAWILEQPWCNGRIGLAGYSASGISAQLLLGAHPPGVRCAFINAASDNFYELVFLNGCYRKNTIEQWVEGKPMLAEFEKHPAYDAFWESRDVRARADTIDVPVYILSGWFDLAQRSATAFFQRVHNNGLPHAHGNCKLLMNTLAHAAPSGVLTFTDRADTNLDAAFGSARDWFAYWLKEEQNGILDKPAVALFLMTDEAATEAPGNTWRFYENWPPAATPKTLYLHEGGKLLAAPPQRTESSTAYVYDPASPTPSLGGNNLFPPSGPHDQREIEARSDVVVFETDALREPLTVIGPISVTLYASSDAVDTDFGARLCDVYPDGRSMLVNEGMVRARYRDSNRTETLMAPGTVYAFHIDLWDNALTFAAGHRIRLDIVSCSDPRYDPNPNTGEPFRRHTRTAPARNTVSHDAARPSQLVLPVVSAD